MTAGQRRVLTEYFSRPDVQELGAYSFAKIEGFLFSVVAAPELVLPSEWLPQIFGGELPVFATKREAERITRALMSLYNDIVEDVMRGNGRLPKDIVFREDTIDNLDSDAPVAQWSQGFAQGYYWLEEDWDEHDDKLDGMGLLLWVLGFFAAPGVAKKLSSEIGVSLEEGAADARKYFRRAAADYAALGLECREAARSSGEQAEARYRVEVAPIVLRTRTARNKRCPCGSGRKYKKCCGRSGE